MFGKNKKGDSISHWKIKTLFAFIAVLVFLQVGWWAIVFLNNSAKIASLEIENVELSEAVEKADTQIQFIKTEQNSRNLMFLSEVGFFLIISLVALFLLFRTLRLESKNRRIQKSFMEMVSHEAKTPLTGLKLQLESIKEDFPTLPHLAKGINSSLDEVRRLTSMLDKAFNLYRIESEGMQMEPWHLSEVIEETAHRMAPLFKVRGVTLKHKLDPQAKVRGDRACLQSLVSSLLENAMIHNPSDEKEISVTLSQKNEKIVLGVWDNGPGIPDGEKSLLFDKFYRGKNSKKIPGTGLGLYIAKSIAEAHWGTIQILRGSHFQIVLPAMKS